MRHHPKFAEDREYDGIAFEKSGFEPEVEREYGGPQHRFVSGLSLMSLCVL